MGPFSLSISSLRFYWGNTFHFFAYEDLLPTLGLFLDDRWENKRLFYWVFPKSVHHIRKWFKQCLTIVSKVEALLKCAPHSLCTKARLYFLFYFSFSVLLIKFLNSKICSMNLEKNLKSNLFLLQGVKSEVDFSLWLQEITPFITLFEYKWSYSSNINSAYLQRTGLGWRVSIHHRGSYTFIIINHLSMNQITHAGAGLFSLHN